MTPPERHRRTGLETILPDIAPQPDTSLPVYLANEAFSRQQSWAEGALEAAESLVGRLQSASDRAAID